MFQLQQQGGPFAANFAGALPNYNNRHRFITLYDREYSTPTNGDTTNYSYYIGPAAVIQQGCHNHIKLQNLRSRYMADSSPGVIGDIASGSILLVSFADNSDSYANLFFGRLTFDDM